MTTQQLPDRPPVPAVNLPLLPIPGFGAYVEGDYWQPQAVWPPQPAAERVRRFDLYERLYRGEWRIIDNQSPYKVQANYFRRTSLFFADLLLSSPLALSGVPADIAQALEDTLADALFNVILNQQVYGSAAFRSRAQDGEPIIDSVSPETLFPASDGTAAIAVVANDKLTVDRLGPGRAARQVFAFSGAIGKLESLEFYPTIRELPIVGAGRRPSDGKPWGQAPYDDMASLVLEISRRLSETSEVLTEHASPLLMLKRDANAAKIFNPGDSPEAAAIRLTMEQYRLDSWRKAPVVTLGDEFSDAKYVSYDPQLQGASNQLAEVENQLFAAAGIPGALFGILRGGTINSGVAMRRQFAPTYVAISSTQRYMIPRIRRAVAYAAQAAGYSTRTFRGDSHLGASARHSRPPNRRANRRPNAHRKRTGAIQ